MNQPSHAVDYPWILSSQDRERSHFEQFWPTLWGM